MAKYTESKKAANHKWDAKNLWRVSLALPMSYKPAVQEAAKSAGLSVNAYLRQIVANALAGLE